MIDTIKRILKPILPEHFDKNEWYILAIFIVICIALYYVHRQKELLVTEMVSIFLFNLMLVMTIEYFFALPPYDFYDTFDYPTWELADIPVHLVVYPGTLLYLMHWFKKHTPGTFLFIAGCTILLTGLEALSVYVFSIIQYNKWNIGLSFIFYIFVMGVNVIYYKKQAYLIKRRLEST